MPYKNYVYDTLLSSLKQCLLIDQPLQLHEPFFSHAEEANVIACIKTGWVSYQGQFVKDFETELARVCGARHAILVASGTVALFVALKNVGVQKDHEVLVPSLTFVATANAVQHIGAIAHFIEVSRNNLGIDVEMLDNYLSTIGTFNSHGECINKLTGRVIKAIVPVHIFGHPVNMDPLLVVAKKYGLVVVEDAAESVGSLYKGRPVGALSDIGILSFNGNKIITTGGGGAIITNNDAIAAQIKHETTTAKKPHAYEFEHDQIGYNFRMPNLNAALGLAQLERLDYFVQQKRLLAASYEQAFYHHEYATFVKEPVYAKSNYWLNALMLRDNCVSLKNELLRSLHQDKIYARPLWKPLHQLEIYQHNPRASDLSVTDDLYNRLICLPSSVFLYERKQENLRSHMQQSGLLAS